ncbi:uncharacterized protein LTR77_007126 [Saxophila tyrrhenica]|uniref:DNA (cytosine-5)-methyltransferase 1 replication foci domain-containing protein n=1 Tax=Saxophila tyrrhenica TaxID=1690608 RepID=A0AAV9P4A9_9PEZI|nr:hypothetical protein LTR77_007126 [Saxophila tyrrhenica]
MPPRLLPESTVLRPRDPADIDTDQWPIFELVDASVTDPNNENAPATLLHASAQYPLTVTGRLRPLPKHLSQLYLPQSQRSSPIEITDVRSFSYGAWEDGSIGLWACGKAGWFLISPSASYKSIYDSMTEAVKLLHFIADTYKSTRKIGKMPGGSSLGEYSATEMFALYASKVMRGKATADEAAEKVYEHRLFLLSSVIAGKEGIAWSKNPLYVHLRQKFPSDRARARDMLFGTGSSRASAGRDVVAPARRPSMESTSTSSSLKRKRGRPPKDSDVISIASSSVASAGGKGRVSQTKNEVDSKPPAKAGSSGPATSRQTRTRAGSQTATQSATPETPPPPKKEDDEDSDIDAIHPRNAKSALRLKPNVSSKGPTRSTLTTAKDKDQPDGRRRSSLAALHYTRHRDSATSRRLKSELDEGISMPTSPSSTSQADGGGPDTLPGASDAHALNHAPDPIQQDTWICALAGCTHKVYAASTPASQALIRQHYALHACDDDERVQMVKELQAPSLPVGRLVERVRLQVKGEGFPGSRVAGTRFPEALKRSV